MTIGTVQLLGAALLTGGLSLLGVLASADAEGEVAAGWWLLGWGAIAAGLLFFAVPPSWRNLTSRAAARRRRLADTASARASYVAPVAREVTYNEGRWWLIAHRGSQSSSSVRCQVFDPLGRSPSKAFAESGSNSVVLTYPDDFGIDRPLPTGEHTVVWSLGTRDGGSEEVRASFVVADDAAELAALRDDLRALRVRGRELLGEVPLGDSVVLDVQVSAFFQELRDYLENSPHLGRSEWVRVSTAAMHSEAPPLEAARIEIQAAVERIDELVERFGGS